MIRDDLSQLRASNSYLQEQVAGLLYELHQRDLRLVEKDRSIAQLEQRVEELKQQATSDSPAPTPPSVKANVLKRKPKPPGRPPGHPAALRPMPKKIDRHQTVPLPKDAGKKPICPHCRTRLAQLRRHRRMVEDLIQATVETTCYHTYSRQCPHCHTQFESRDPQQPPASSLPHGQLGLNASAFY